MSPPIAVLETKLYIPRWPAGLVTRPRLMQRIREDAHRKLTVVSAPAGSGKTTLLAEWLAQRSADDPPVGWVSLDAADNDPAAFWTCFIRALQNVDAGIGRQALGLNRTDAGPTVAELTALLNEIAALDRDVVLILDDYHVIETPAIHTALAFVLDHLPPRMHIILATRADPLLPIARMRARGEVTELRAADLRFSGDEASTFLNGVMTLDLAAADVAALEKRTEGWIAGLKLAALSMQHHDDVHGFIQSFSGDNRYVADYLIEEVLHAQPERTRRFLLGTAMLERLSAPLCDAVTAETGSQGLLESLEKSNLFVIALDDRREWYRYHHLFAEVLQAYAVREDAEQVRALHRRASRWYEQHGSNGEAVHHAMNANDLDRVAELLERNWPAMDRTYQSRRWLTRVKALPESLVRSRPMLNMGFAWALMNAGELEAAAVRLDEVAASIDGDERSILRRELATARVYLAQSRGDFAGTIEHARHSLSLVSEDDHLARSMAAALLALAYFAHGELDAAHDTFAAALVSMRSADRMLDAIRGMFVLGDIRVAQGRLREATTAYEAGLEMAAAHGSSAVAETDELHLGLSELARERGDLQEATRILLDVDQRASRAGHAGNRHRWLIGMARIVEAHGEFDRALQLVTEAETVYRRDPLPVVRPFATMRARLWIAQGNIAAATLWAGDHAVSEDDELSFIREFDHITLARLLMAQGSFDRALRLLERLAPAATAGGRLGSLIETLVLQARAHFRLGNTRASLDAIASALEHAEPEGYLRVFVDEGTPMRDLLRQATARGIAGAYTRHVLAAFEDGADRGRAAPASATPPQQLLTARELEILRLIAAGMRNQEIAAQLFISPATVKRHIANVYNKLDARHRTDALKRAGVLNLL